MRRGKKKSDLKQIKIDQPLGEVELIESDRTTKRVLCVLQHLQDVVFILTFMLLHWDTI